MLKEDDRDIAEDPGLGHKRLEAKDHKGGGLDDKRST